MMVIVPISCIDKVTKNPVRRQSKLATLVNCICADGTMTKPLLIFPRKTPDSVLLKRIICYNVIMKYQEKVIPTQILSLNGSKKNSYIHLKTNGWKKAKEVDIMGMLF